MKPQKDMEDHVQNMHVESDVDGESEADGENLSDSDDADDPKCLTKQLDNGHMIWTM